MVQTRDFLFSWWGFKVGKSSVKMLVLSRDLALGSGSGAWP